MCYSFLLKKNSRHGCAVIPECTLNNFVPILVRLLVPIGHRILSNEIRMTNLNYGKTNRTDQTEENLRQFTILFQYRCALFPINWTFPSKVANVFTTLEIKHRCFQWFHSFFSREFNLFFYWVFPTFLIFTFLCIEVSVTGLRLKVWPTSPGRIV